MSDQTTRTGPAVFLRSHGKCDLATFELGQRNDGLSWMGSQTLNTISNGLFPAMLLVDSEGWVDYANRSAAELLESGEAADSHTGHPLAEHGRIPWLAGVLTESCCDRNGIYHAEISLVSGGRVRIYDIRASKMGCAGLTYCRYAVVFEDITENRDPEQFLMTGRL